MKCGYVGLWSNQGCNEDAEPGERFCRVHRVQGPSNEITNRVWVTAASWESCLSLPPPLPLYALLKAGHPSTAVLKLQPDKGRQAPGILGGTAGGISGVRRRTWHHQWTKSTFTNERMSLTAVSRR